MLKGGENNRFLQDCKKSCSFTWRKKRESVANERGLSLSALAMYENGVRIPRDENKEKITRYYGKTVDENFFA